jgi:WhiB family redox-sensing transcriptional regulator
MSARIEVHPEWMADAKCLTVGDPDDWFTDANQGRDSTHPAQREAIKTCRACPVAEKCLMLALGRRERWGVWGATTPNQRRKILDRMDAA